jgi:slime mold repeat-containing protein
MRRADSKSRAEVDWTERQPAIGVMHLRNSSRDSPGWSGRPASCTMGPPMAAHRRSLCTAIMRALLFSTASGCGGCDNGSLTPGSFRLDVDKPVLEFGNVFIGASKEGTLSLSTEGSLAVAYMSSFEGDAFGFEAGPAIGRIAPNSAVQIHVTFRPGKQGLVRPLLVFTARSGQGGKTATAAVQISGTGVLPPDCEDGNGCTVDNFNLTTGQCEHQAERLPCEDFNACTTMDTCVDGVCLGQSLDCDDHNVCTDDLCDRAQGCRHILAARCDDGNPCSADTCDPVDGCKHTTQPDGTPCDDGRSCTFADICILGNCIGVNAPEGAPCDDGDPCSKHDQCVAGVCKDPTYARPEVGELKYATDVGPLAEGAPENPIIDRDSSVFVGIEGGVAAVDRCGALLWKNTTLGSSRFSGATSLPGLLVVPIGSRIVDLETREGRVLRTLELKDIFENLTSSTAMSATSTSTTTTTSIRILDLALRASGGVIASVVRQTVRLDGRGVPQTEGVIAEIDRLHAVATIFQRLGQLHASRLAVDADEAVVAILRSGDPDKGVTDERLVRFGLAGLPETSWSTTPVSARHGELALGGASEVLWTAGLVSVARDGRATTLLRDAPELATFAYGSPVLTSDDVFLARRTPDAGESAPGFAGLLPQAGGTGSSSPSPYELLRINPGAGIVWRRSLDRAVIGMSPAVDLAGNVYLVTSDGTLHGWTPDGAPRFSPLMLPISGDEVDHLALGISPDGVVVAVARGRVFGVQSRDGLGSSSWPKHRRDNLATGHR